VQSHGQLFLGFLDQNKNLHQLFQLFLVSWDFKRKFIWWFDEMD